MLTSGNGNVRFLNILGDTLAVSRGGKWAGGKWVRRKRVGLQSVRINMGKNWVE